MTRSDIRGRVRLAAEREGPEAGAVVVFAHGWLSERSSRGRFEYLAGRYRAAGYATVRFDFAGCGDSEDAPVTDAGMIADLRAVLDQVSEWGYRRIALHGHSHGGSVCLRTADPRPAAMVLTGSGTGATVYDWAEHLPAEVLRGIQADGRARMPGGHLLTRESLDGFAADADLSAVRQPVLLMYGDAADDPEELMLARLARERLPALPAGSRLDIISGADHTMEGHLEEVAARGLAWLERHCPA